MALVRCMPQAPILPLSIASCAAAISFCAAILFGPSAIVSMVDSDFIRLSLLQPLIFAACAGTTARERAASTAAPIIVFFILFPHFDSKQSRRYCQNLQKD